MEYRGLDGRPITHPPMFRLFTRESMTKIRKRIQEEKQAKDLLKQQEEELGKEDDKNKLLFDEDKPRPNPLLMQGMVLPSKMGEFPPEMCGMPIEDFDEYYHNKYTFVVVAKDKTIFRFSSSNGFFFLSPFNPVRRIAIYILTHPFFSLCVMLVILVNCIFMAINREIPHTEATFTGIYTVEGLIKLLARGFILANFTYLRDMWNWLDFIVVTFAYMTMALGDLGGKVAVLRTFRVLRALKTVAVVPGLKTIVGALMEAVRRLRDVAILSLFVLSIFALIGLQLYQGTLMKKCVRMENITWFKLLPNDDQLSYAGNRSNWQDPDKQDGRICGDSGSQCNDGYKCVSSGLNPDFGYTTYDNFAWALLCAFRLMTQDYWENLYQLTLKANGPGNVLFFMIVIFLGSFYLVNLILAIVAMSYDDCRKQDQEAEDAEAEEALAEEARLQELEDAANNAALQLGSGRFSHSDFSSTSIDQYLPRKVLDKEALSMKSECAAIGYQRRMSLINSSGKKICSSLPGSPNQITRSRKFNWSHTGHQTANNYNDPYSMKMPGHSQQQQAYLAAYPAQVMLPEHIHNNYQLQQLQQQQHYNDKRPVVLPCLENVDLPFADDSTLNTPSADHLCNFQNAHNFIAFKQRFTAVPPRFPNRRTSYSSPLAQFSPRNFEMYRNRAAPDRKCEPTHFHWTTTGRQRTNGGPPTSAARKNTGDFFFGRDFDTCKDKMFADNPFICLTPSPSSVNLKDVLVLKDLINHASGKKNFFGLDEGQSKKEFFKTKCHQLLFGWQCHPNWYLFAHFVELFIMDAFVDLFITLCIVINTLFMAMEHDGMTPTMIATLKYGNYVFTGIFTVEAVLKISALGLYKYLQDKWSCFDIVIVILSLVELGLSGVKGLSILRSFRLLRVFKLAKSWPTLNLLIGIIGRTMGALGNLCFVLLIIVFIFAVMGMQLFGPNYSTFFGHEMPGWNFTDFLHSFMIVFRVLCGEWIESMWNCIRCSGSICIPFFLLTMIIGNLVVLNLFLALLLSSFGAESLKHSEEDEGPNKLQEAIDRINRFIVFVKSNFFYCIKSRGKRKRIRSEREEGRERTQRLTKNEQYENGRVNGQDVSLIDLIEGSPHHHHAGLHSGSYHAHKAGDTMSHVAYTSVPAYEKGEVQIKQMCNEDRMQLSHMVPLLSGLTYTGMPSHHSVNSSSTSSPTSPTVSKGHGSQHSVLSSSNYSYSAEDLPTTGKVIEGPEVHEVEVVFVKYPDDCCPQSCMNLCKCFQFIETTKVGQTWWAFRRCMFELVENNYFETFIIVMILLSSLALAVEDVYIENPERWLLKTFLKIMDKVFTVIFLFEMFIKQSAYGFKKYFTDAWCWLDFVIVVISLLSLFAESAGYGNIGAFRALRTLRALRPLRAVSRWEGMKVVVNALIQAIPAIFNVLLVCLVFWLIFSIMGVNLFGGKFKQCLDANKVRVNVTDVANKTDCEAKFHLNYTWYNPKINFDNVLAGYLALFQVATFKGWVDIMDNAINSKPEEDQQPEHEVRSGMYMYFVFFIVFGAFFTLNLFIGVIIENFNMQKKKAGGSLEMLMTEDQKKYYNAMKKLGSKQPQKPIPKPKIKIQLLFFQLTTSQKFDIFIMIIILLNMMTMAIEHYDQSKTLEITLFYVNIVFVVIFSCECVMKLVGLRHYYFKQPWNVFDFVVVISSVLATAFLDQTEHMKDLPISPTLLRVVRVFRVGRILRLVKSAKGIRTLLFSLAVSMPALFNIGLLLFLVMFIYAIFGMSFFMHVKHTKGIDDMFNFETFFRSMILLFQVSTSAGWDGVLAGLMNEEFCNKTQTEIKPNGDCGSSGEAVLYLVTYLVISFLVVINMYIAVILENFSQATEDVQQGLTQDDFDMYYEVWEKFDENATQYIHLSKLCEFVDSLEPPLRIPMPNYYRLVSLDIPICENDMIHCVDILDGLTKNFLGTSEVTGDLGDIKKGPERKNYNPVSSTLKRQREIFVVRLLQQTWRNYVKQKQREAMLKRNADRTIITVDEVDET